ncbi:MAG: radical SAM protein [Anaerolineaceae bacterium]|nr:radical SAM protein [Anaerolineaceae bacterium]
MKQKDYKPIIHRRPDVKMLREELKFLKRLDDVKYFQQKAAFVLPRLLDRVDRWTNVPPSVEIEPTNFCNLNCITCGQSESPRPKGFMKMDLFKKIVDDAAELGIKRIQLYLLGEPMMHPKIIDMIRYIKTKDIGFHLTTNGTLLTKEKSEEILSSGVTSADYLTVSILGFTKEVHEKVMRGVNHEQIVEDLLYFVEARKRLKVNGPVVETVFYSIKENEHEVQPWLDYWGKIVDHANFGGKAIEAFIDQSLPTTLRTRTCSILWERMAVYWNGDVSICGEDMDGELIVGNLREQSIQEVWLGEKLTHLKQLHKEGKFDQISICKYCDW